MSRSFVGALLCATVLVAAQPALAEAPADPAVELLRAQPGNDGLAVAVARQAAAKGDLGTAADYLTICLTAPGEHRQARGELGWVRFLQGQKADALTQLQAANNGTDSLTLGRLSLVLTESGQRDAAIKAALATLKLPAKDGHALALMALGAMTDNLQRAADYLQASIKLSPSPWAYFWLGKQGGGDDAYLEAYRRSLASTDPFDRKAQEPVEATLLAKADKSTEFRKRWVKLLDELVTAHPENEALSERLINAYQRDNQPEFAIAELRRRLGLATDKVAIIRRIADIYVALNQDQLALETYERATKLSTNSKDPGALSLRCDKVELWLNQGREAEAATELDQLLTLAPDFHRAKLLRGLCYALKRDWGQAAKAVAGVEPVTTEERLLVNFVRRQDGKPARWTQIFSGG